MHTPRLSQSTNHHKTCFKSQNVSQACQEEITKTKFRHKQPYLDKDSRCCNQMCPTEKVIQPSSYRCPNQKCQKEKNIIIICEDIPHQEREKEEEKMKEDGKKNDREKEKIDRRRERVRQGGERDERQREKDGE